MSWKATGMAHPSKTSSDEGREKTSLWLMYVLVGLCTLGVVGGLVCGLYLTDRMTTQNNSIVRAAMNIRLEATTSHLRLKEMLTGDTNVDWKDVSIHLDRAGWYVRALSEGGTSQHGEFRAVRQKQLRRDVEDLSRQLSEFAELSEEMSTNARRARADSELSLQYEESFAGITARAGALEKKARQAVEGNSAVFRQTQAALILGCLLLAVLALTKLDGLIRGRTRHERQLNTANQQLLTGEKRLLEVNRKLDRRVRELDCLHGLAQLASDRHSNMEDVFAGLVDLIAAAWNHPDVACARVVFQGREFKIGHVRSTGWRHSADIEVDGKKAGKLEVCYFEVEQQSESVVFPEEEKRLLETIAGRLGKIVESKRARAELDERVVQLAKTRQAALSMMEEAERARSEAEQAAEEVRKGRENLEAIFNAAPVGLLLVDEQAEVKKINDVAEKLAEKNPGQMPNMRLGQGLGCRKGGNDPKECRSDSICLSCKIRGIVEKVLGTGQSAHVVEIGPETAEEQRNCLWMQVSAEMVSVDGQKHALVALSDVTDRRQAEDGLRSAKEQAEQAEAKVREINRDLEASIERANMMAEEAMMADQAKSEFLANISHEIRTPMTAILGYTDLMLDQSLTASDRDNYLAVVRRNGEHLLTLINDILDLSKIEAGKLKMDIRSCSLMSVVADVASLMRMRSDQRGTSLSAEYTTELPETIQSDSARLRQALINLVGNAVKFTENGSVRIVTTFLPKWREDKPAVEIKVTDTGIGISEELLPRLFDAFVQADASTSRQYGGTGLGLAITRHIAKLLGGELTAESKPGKGSEFTLVIPTGPLDGVKILTAPAEAVQEGGQDGPVGLSHAVGPDTLAGRRVLLAEDGPDNQRLIGTVLRKAGAEVEVAENGQIAVGRALAAEFDVILMDMQMPELDGYQATQKLRRRGWSGPIIALTAHAQAGDRERCLQAGCDAYLAKPINRAQLIETVADYAESAGRSQPTGETVSCSDQGSRNVIYSELADEVELVEIIDEFVAGLSEQVRVMREELKHGQYEDLRRLAHQLKGAGGSYGYAKLSEVARGLEQAAKDEDHEAAELALAEVSEVCQAAAAGRKIKA